MKKQQRVKKILNGEIDLISWYGRNINDQETWIDYANKHNLAMISAADVYRAGKSGNAELIKSLRKDFRQSWKYSEVGLITSTRIDASPLESKVIHYAGSSLVKPIVIPKVVRPEIDPEYSNANLTDVLDIMNGLKYVQAIFNTTDDKEEIIRTLQQISNKKPKQMYITPSDNNHDVSAVSFMSGKKDFEIYCNTPPEEPDMGFWCGFSRGVK